MRILGMMVIMMSLTAGLASAATINLVDGRAVQGDIVKQDSKSLQISVDGVTMTYYADEIKDIDGKPFNQSDAAAPAAVAQPDTTAPAPAVQTDAVAPVPVAQPAAVPQPEAAAPAPIVQPETAAPVPVSEAGAIDPEKQALILKFMDVFGTRQALTNNFNAMVVQIAKDKPDEAQTIRQRVKIDEIIHRLVPIYDRNFTSDDLKAFISFYGSPEGQKLIQTIPVLMRESVQESIKYMQEKFPEVKNGQ